MKNKKKILLLILLAVACGISLNTFASGHEATPAYPNFGLPRLEEMMFLVLQIGIIIFAAKLGGMVATFLKMPSILGELAAGILIGPWCLGGIGFGDGFFKYGLFHGAALKAMNAVADGSAQAMFGTCAGNGTMFAATSPALYGIATLASIILLFLSGLETNLKMFLKYSFVGSMVGIGGVVVSFLLGDLCAVYFLPQYFDSFKCLAEMPLGKAMMESAPLYMGIMSTATSVGITARILSERKKMDSEEGVTIMAGAVIDDVLGLIVLAIGNGIIAAAAVAAEKGTVATAGVNWAEIGMVALKAFGVWLGGTLIGVILARKISWLLKLVKDPKVIGTLAFGLSMIVAGFFESMGLAMIIGAYVMGLALSRTDLKHLIMENLLSVYTFLVPIFFCVMGMMVDIKALCSEKVLVFGAIYTVIAIIAKIVGCAIPSLFCGFTPIGSLRIGMGMVPRGEVALIIAGLGLSKGYLSSEIFGIGILMTLVTTVVAPPGLVGLFAINKKGVKKQKESMTGSRIVTFDLEKRDIAELMLDKLVQQFRMDGCFTCLLSAENHIWHISMDSLEITLSLNGTKIEIECTPEEEAIVLQAWTEVLSQMNELAATLAKPIEDNKRVIKETLINMEASEDSKKKNILNKILSNYIMLPSLKVSSKNELFEKMVHSIMLAHSKDIKDKQAILDSVMQREAAMPTGLDNGIAVPHGRTNAVNEIYGAIALIDNSKSPNGAISDYETIDHSMLQVVILTIAPETSSTSFLQLMSSICKIFHNKENIDNLLKCTSSQQMRSFFKHVK